MLHFTSEVLRQEGNGVRYWILICQALMRKYRKLALRSQIVFVLLGLPIFFFFDGPEFNAVVPYGQWFDNYIMFWTFVWIYCFAGRRLKMMMLLATIIGLGLEIIGSILLGAYVYRLGNVPFYVPLGHAVIVALVHNFYKEKFIHQNAHYLTPIGYALCISLSLYSLIVYNDRAGMLLFMGFIVLLQGMKQKLSHLISFLFCYYLEMFGTQMQTWTWYSALGHHPSWPHIANPPPGIGTAYLMLHVLTLNAYCFGLKMKCRRLRLGRQVKA
jgi:hypothetical protein